MIYQRIVIGQFQNQHLVWNDTRVANCSCQMPTQTYKNSYHFSLSFKLLWQNRCNKSCCLFVKGFITQFDALGRFQMQLMAMASWLIRQVGFWTACHIKMNWSCLTVQKRVSIKCLCEMRPVSSFWTLIFGGLAAAEDCRTCVSKFFQWWNGWLGVRWKTFCIHVDIGHPKRKRNVCVWDTNCKFRLLKFRNNFLPENFSTT